MFNFCFETYPIGYKRRYIKPPATLATKRKRALRKAGRRAARGLK